MIDTSAAFDASPAVDASTLAELSTVHLLEVFAQAPRRLRRSLEGLMERHVVARPVPGKWSIREIVVHLADAEVIGAGRFRQALAEPGSTFACYDQDVWAQRLDYQSTDGAAFAATLDLFEALRRTTHGYLARAPEGAWGHEGRHPEDGPISLRGLLERYATHGERHLLQIVERRRRLGVPIPWSPLVPAALL